MKTTRLGRTGLVVSRLCLGTMNFGPFATDEESFAILDRARELGMNFVDTANVYGRDKGRGYTEQVIGRWFDQGGGRRDDVVLATKVYGKMGDKPNESRLSSLAIRKAVEASLSRLQTDRIELYQMHHVDRETPWEEIWEAFDRLVTEGKVVYVGSSNFAGWHLATAQEEARRRHSFGLVSEQSLYNLTQRTVELEVVPACEHYGLGLLPWSPLAGGALAGALDRSDGRRGDDWVKKSVDRHRERIEPYEAFCRELGEEPAIVALAWLLHQKAVTAPIIGPRTLEQLDGAMRALEVELSADALQKLDEIWPGPGGQAPEAYAW